MAYPKNIYKKIFFFPIREFFQIESFTRARERERESKKVKKKVADKVSHFISYFEKKVNFLPPTILIIE
jgi:hypothetical protein